MIIYNPENMIQDRIKQAGTILENMPYRYCFITGSFLFKENYKDVDIFAITRSKKKLKKGIKLTIIDFENISDTEAYVSFKADLVQYEKDISFS